jgi:hypothetical protein
MMNPQGQPEPRCFCSRPADESLQAYKEWIFGMVMVLGSGEAEAIAEEDWRQGWLAFGGKTENKHE